MKSNLDPRTIIERDVCFGSKKVKSITRIYCELCGEVVSIKIEHYDGKTENMCLDEYHTDCSE